MTLFVILGAIALVAGVATLVTGIRRGPDASPRNRAMLIGGMMLAAFGLVIGGFAIAYQTAAPLNLNASSAQ